MEAAEIKEIAANYHLIKHAQALHPILFRAVRRFNYLRALPQQSEFTLVAYFAVLESLVTHCPGGTETFDSLSHQLRTKMELLCKRFQRALDYTVFGGGLKGAKL